MGRGDLGITLPAGWARRSDPDRGVLLAARSPSPTASGVRPEVTLRCVPVAEDLATWRDLALAELGDRLVDFEVEDADDYTLDGRPVAYRRFAHRVALVDVVCEQWSWAVDGLGVTLTGSVAREDYPAYCEVFEQIAETVDLGASAVT
jgi:hypothetical protein